jgi:hypothetical protein
VTTGHPVGLEFWLYLQRMRAQTVVVRFVSGVVWLHPYTLTYEYQHIGSHCSELGCLQRRAVCCRMRCKEVTLVWVPKLVRHGCVWTGSWPMAAGLALRQVLWLLVSMQKASVALGVRIF